MKLLIYLLIWIPVSLSLFLFSSFKLMNLKKHPAAKVLGSSSSATPINFIPTPSLQIILKDTQPSVDVRIAALSKFFRDYQSPLLSQVEILVKQADTWGLDYALIPAISMQESRGCKTIPVNSYNCWGFGIYGSKITRFESYESAINQVAKTIKETYIKKGLTNPTLLEDRWAPSSRGLWSYSVNFFIGKIRELEKNIPGT